MGFKDILKNKTNVILILIIILVGVLLYLNNVSVKYIQYTNNTREKFEVNEKLQFKVFYTNWCGWSKRALATINSDEFKKKFEEIKNRAEIVLVDCEGSGKEECVKRKIQGYPTMQLQKGNNMIDFNGDRTPDGIINFIKQNENL
jgi:thiol-disulfide isomerase/thioredoxin